MDRPNISWSYNILQCSLAHIIRGVDVPCSLLRVTPPVGVPITV